MTQRIVDRLTTDLTNNREGRLARNWLWILHGVWSQFSGAKRS
jgi:hypothetical protein